MAWTSFLSFTRIINPSKVISPVYPSGEITLDGVIILDIHLLKRPYVYIITFVQVFYNKLIRGGPEIQK